MIIPDPSRLRLSFLAWGIAIAASLLATANFMTWLVRDGLDAATNPDGGGGSTAAILLLIGGFGALFGLPLAALARTIAPRSWLVALIALALFCAFGCWFNASPVFVPAHWVEGALLTFGFALSALVAGAAAQWLGGRLRPRPGVKDL